jgi:hypothetical protein
MLERLSWQKFVLVHLTHSYRIKVPKNTVHDALYEARFHAYRLRLLHQKTVQMKVSKCVSGFCPVLKKILLSFKAYCFMMKQTSALMGRLTNRTFAASLKRIHSGIFQIKSKELNNGMVWCVAFLCHWTLFILMALLW